MVFFLRWKCEGRKIILSRREDIPGPVEDNWILKEAVCAWAEDNCVMQERGISLVEDI